MSSRESPTITTPSQMTHKAPGFHQTPTSFAQLSLPDPPSSLQLGYIGFSRNKSQLAGVEGNLPAILENSKTRLSVLDPLHTRMANEAIAYHKASLSTPRTLPSQRGATMKDIFSEVDFALSSTQSAKPTDLGIGIDPVETNTGVTQFNGIALAEGTSATLELDLDGDEDWNDAHGKEEQRRLSVARLQMLDLDKEGYVLVDAENQTINRDETSGDNLSDNNNPALTSDQSPLVKDQYFAHTMLSYRGGKYELSSKEISDFELDADGSDDDDYDAESDFDTDDGQNDEYVEADNFEGESNFAESDTADDDVDTAASEYNYDDKSCIDPNDPIAHEVNSVRSQSPGLVDDHRMILGAIGPDMSIAFPPSHVIFDHLLAEDDVDLMESIERRNESFAKEMRRMSILPQDELAVDEGGVSEDEEFDDQGFGVQGTQSSGYNFGVSSLAPSESGGAHLFLGYGSEEDEAEIMDVEVQRILLDEHQQRESPVNGKGKGKAID
ncbi:hypothetical protein DFH27DRAFT_33851 [Peziza echinospora]|nr:hypothetical protein DFH27DRAFT_33851 [Peziza echinospora]